MENRDRHDVQEKLVQATRNCTNFYAKGKRSFEVLAKLTDTRHFGEAPAKLWQNPAHSGSEVGINAGTDGTFSTFPARGNVPSVPAFMARVSGGGFH